MEKPLLENDLLGVRLNLGTINSILEAFLDTDTLRKKVAEQRYSNNDYYEFIQMWDAQVPHPAPANTRFSTYEYYREYIDLSLRCLHRVSQHIIKGLENIKRFDIENDEVFNEHFTKYEASNKNLLTYAEEFINASWPYEHAKPDLLKNHEKLFSEEISDIRELASRIQAMRHLLALPDQD